MMCTQAGADCVIVEEVVTAQAMQQAVTERLMKMTRPAEDAGAPSEATEADT